ncbi:MAG: hypothetical protein AAB509_02010 [Patescibacteria group bacterium]
MAPRKLEVFRVEGVHIAVIHFVTAFLRGEPWSCECKDCKISRIRNFSVFTSHCITDRTKLIALMILMDEKTFLTFEDIALMPDEEVRDRFERIFIGWKHELALVAENKTGVREKGVKLLTYSVLSESEHGRKGRVVRKSEPMAG